MKCRNACSGMVRHSSVRNSSITKCWKEFIDKEQLELADLASHKSAKNFGHYQSECSGVIGYGEWIGGIGELFITVLILLLIVVLRVFWMFIGGNSDIREIRSANHANEVR